MVDKQALKIKLAEWAGLHPRERSDGQTIQRIDQPNFTESLDACFKWLVPALWICNITLLDGIFWSVEVSIPDVHGYGKHGDGKALNESLALALCLAIEKLIDGSK